MLHGMAQRQEEGHLEVCEGHDAGHIHVALQEGRKVGQDVAVADHAGTRSELWSAPAFRDATNGHLCEVTVRGLQQK